MYCEAIMSTCFRNRITMFTDCVVCFTDKTPSPTMSGEATKTMQVTTKISSHTPTPVYQNTGSVGREATMGNPSPSNYPMFNPLELVMVLDAPLVEVNKKWNDFSLELASMLKRHSLSPVAMDVKEDK